MPKPELMSEKSRNSESSVPGAPCVSAIMIFLNGEDFIGEAIESVLEQTLDDWELILVDDGSTEGATGIARRFAASHPGRITCIEHPGHENRGMSASRNAGLRAARGRYVAFLDADDIWLPERLQVHADILNKNPDVSMVVGPTLLWTRWVTTRKTGRGIGSRGEMITELGLPCGRPIAPPIMATGFLESHGGNVPGICSLTARRKDILAVGGFDDSFRTLYEDQVFFFRMCLRYKVHVIDKVLDCYRQHPDSACHASGGSAGDIMMRPVFLNWLQDCMIDEGIKDRRLWTAFRREMFRFDNPRLYWWASIPRRVFDRWTVLTCRLVIWILTPKGYNWLRRKFRLSVVDSENVW